jgi:hypothetical protein
VRQLDQPWRYFSKSKLAVVLAGFALPLAAPVVAHHAIGAE